MSKMATSSRFGSSGAESDAAVGYVEVDVPALVSRIATVEVDGRQVLPRTSVRVAGDNATVTLKVAAPDASLRLTFDVPVLTDRTTRVYLAQALAAGLAATRSLAC